MNRHVLRGILREFNRYSLIPAEVLAVLLVPAAATAALALQSPPVASTAQRAVVRRDYKHSSMVFAGRLLNDAGASEAGVVVTVFSSSLGGGNTSAIATATTTANGLYWVKAPAAAGSGGRAREDDRLGVARRSALLGLGRRDRAGEGGPTLTWRIGAKIQAIKTFRVEGATDG